MRVYRHRFPRRSAERRGVELGPQVVLVPADHVGQAPSVARVGNSTGYPSLNGFGVDAEPSGYVDVSETRVGKCAAQRVVHRSSTECEGTIAS
jgi:hypothetical protein